MDAYEFSFVAVPAQRDAGVLKALGGRKSLGQLAEEFAAELEELKAYEKAVAKSSHGRKAD